MKKTVLLFALSLAATAAYGDVGQAVNDLIPKLADANVPSRYPAQMELQAIAAQSSRPGHETERAELAKVLASKVIDASVPQPARVWLVRQLEYMGACEAVEALANLMAGEDAELRECARRALQKNSAPTAAASLRAALENAQDTTWKIGLISALGDRRDAQAVSLISRFLDDAAVSKSAVNALSKIATPLAVEALWTAYDRQNPAAPESLIEAGNRLVAAGNRPLAAVIYQLLYRPGNSAPIRAAALCGLARSDIREAVKLIPAALAGDEPRLQNAAVLAAPAAFGKELSSTLGPLLPTLSPGVKAQVLGLLDASAETLVIAAATQSDDNVRLAAIEALGRIGGSASVPILAKLATSETRPEQAAANAALASISGNGAAAAVEKAAASGESKLRAAAINALAARKDQAAMAALLQYATEPDAIINKAAFAALGQMGSDAEVEPLAKLTLQSKDPEAVKAMKAVANRVKDRPAAAHKLLAVAADELSQTSLLEAFSVLGGQETLSAVSKLLSSQSAETQVSAVRALGNWSDFGAVKPLLDIVQNPSAEASQKILAFQGVARLIKSSENEPVEIRAEAALTALEAARREEDKKQVLSALATVPHPKAIAAIKGLLVNPELKRDAGFAGLALAQLLAATDKAAAKDLAEAIRNAAISDDLTRQANRLLRR